MRRRIPNEVGIAAVVVIVAIVLSIMSPTFRTISNVEILLLNGAVIAFLALGQTFVLLTGGIDLSTGSNIALTGMVAALAMQAGLPWYVAVLAAVAIGLLVGTFNGAVVYYLKLPPFIVTFATFGVAASIPLILTGANSVPVRDPFFAIIGRGALFGIPMPVVLVILAVIIFAIVLRYTATGVHFYAVGGNAETSRLAGVRSGRVIMLAYAMSGLCSAFGGLITTSRLMVGYPSAGSGNELFYSIAAAVVGGVSLFGGIGSIGGALLGAVLIATVSNGMNVIGVESYWQPLVIGVIILVGVILDTHRRQLSLRELVKRMSGARSKQLQTVSD
ncbi:monosaccharide ABC transporter membrane protein, CUT2 family [Paramicrobacterium humi]|uniref:Monosaccharide ABC transporter membrane protein, CUT2 family n=1 Tax=Paramicrobacterium humi TaxID=640635 RepID=A0A1H4KUA7_9MICO|nr:ABC transporter permease [Microbacterium humi]SEB62114.1 monosaccharide ABC transporter membrane protein, CUT2 family [Microbacterium humi]